MITINFGDGTIIEGATSPTEHEYSEQYEDLDNLITITSTDVELCDVRVDRTYYNIVTIDTPFTYTGLVFSINGEYTIDWGDTNTEKFIGTDIEHTYTDQEQNHKITIKSLSQYTVTLEDRKPLPQLFVSRTKFNTTNDYNLTLNITAKGENITSPMYATYGEQSFPFDPTFNADAENTTWAINLAVPVGITDIRYTCEKQPQKGVWELTSDASQLTEVEFYSNFAEINNITNSQITDLQTANNTISLSNINDNNNLSNIILNDRLQRVDNAFNNSQSLPSAVYLPSTVNEIVYSFYSSKTETVYCPSESECPTITFDTDKELTKYATFNIRTKVTPNYIQSIHELPNYHELLNKVHPTTLYENTREQRPVNVKNPNQYDCRYTVGDFVNNELYEYTIASMETKQVSLNADWFIASDDTLTVTDI